MSWEGDTTTLIRSELRKLQQKDLSYISSIDPNPTNERYGNLVTFETLDTRGFMNKLNSSLPFNCSLNTISSSDKHQFTLWELSQPETNVGIKQLLLVLNYYLHHSGSSLLDIQHTEKDGEYVAIISGIPEMDLENEKYNALKGVEIKNIVQISDFEWRIWFQLGEGTGVMYCPDCHTKLGYNLNTGVLSCYTCDYRTPSLKMHYEGVTPFELSSSPETLRKIFD
jgi:hypothetical protein